MTYIDGLPGPFAITARKHPDFDNSPVFVKVVTERMTPENSHDDRVLVLFSILSMDAWLTVRRA